MPIEFESPDVCAECGKDLKNKVFFIPLCNECLEKVNKESEQDQSSEGGTAQ